MVNKILQDTGQNSVLGYILLYARRSYVGIFVIFCILISGLLSRDYPVG